MRCRVTSCAYLPIRSGMLQGVSPRCSSDGGGNGTILIDPGVLTGTGSPTSPTAWNVPARAARRPGDGI